MSKKKKLSEQSELAKQATINIVFGEQSAAFLRYMHDHPRLMHLPFSTVVLKYARKGILATSRS